MKVFLSTARWARGIIFFLAAAVAVLAVMSRPGRTQAPSPAAPAVVRIAYLPVVGKAETIKRYQPLTDYLASSLGLPVEAVSYDGYQEMVLALLQGQFEIAYLSPAVYASAASVARLEVIAVELSEEGEPGYYSIMISRSDGPVVKLEDGRGKVLAFSNRESASGFMAPLHHFLYDLKEPPGVFARQVVFAGDHRAVVKGVYDGGYDLGATNNIEFNYTLKQEKIPAEAFRILWTSDLIPGSPICVRPDLGPELKKRITESLLGFGAKPEGIKALSIGGYRAADNQDLEIAKKLYSSAP